jgi:transcriptional regulator NrdR family protein
MSRKQGLQSLNIKCPLCGSLETRVKETRTTRQYVRRTRECAECYDLFNTAEILVSEYKELRDLKRRIKYFVNRVEVKK